MMPKLPFSKKDIFKLATQNFEQTALDLFRFQAVQNPVYRTYLTNLNVDASKIDRLDQIPFLPIRFFKSHRVLIDGIETEKVFTSSGTTDISERSQHFLSDLAFYEWSSQEIFESIYGKLSELQLFALLPSYLERDGSSLIFMVDSFMKKAQLNSAYFLYEYEKLKEALDQANPEKPILLLGVTFALLDFAHFLSQHYPTYFLPKQTIVMETGGMKGRKKELIRSEVHHLLQEAFKVPTIHSEYGMTELLSQAYSVGNGRFVCPPTMRIILRDINDPFTLGMESGGINVIDLANVESCAFIETQDLGKIYEDGGFEVLGRFDYSDVRGCNLLVIT